MHYKHRLSKPHPHIHINIVARTHTHTHACRKSDRVRDRQTGMKAGRQAHTYSRNI